MNSICTPLREITWEFSVFTVLDFFVITYVSLIINVLRFFAGYLGRFGECSGMAANVTAKVKAARLLFLHGDGDGRRVTNVPTLAKKAGIHEETIRRNLPAWEKDYEEMLCGVDKSALALNLSKEALANRKKDEAFLRDEANSIQWEIGNLNIILARMEDILENFSMNTDNGDEAIKLFDRYIRGSLNKSNLRSQFLAVEKRWSEISGLSALGDVQLTGAKTKAQGIAKMELKKIEEEDAPRNANLPGGGFFKRPQNLDSKDC